MKKIWLVLIVNTTMFAAVINNAQAHDIARGRYTRTHKRVSLSVFDDQKPYTGPESLQGLGHAKARKLGYEGRAVYNQHGRYAEIDILSGDAEVYYNTADMKPRFLSGCTLNGKPYFNMLAFVPEAAPPPPKVVVEEKPVYITEVVERPVPVPVCQRPSGHFVCIPPRFACRPICVRDRCGRPHLVIQRVMVRPPQRIWVSDGSSFAGGRYQGQGEQGLSSRQFERRPPPDQDFADIQSYLAQESAGPTVDP